MNDRPPSFQTGAAGPLTNRATAAPVTRPAMAAAAPVAVAAAEVPAVQPLTEKERLLLRTIWKLREVMGEFPSVYLLARRLDCAPQTLRERMVALQRKGWMSTPRPEGALIQVD